ncbi:alpha/beta-Hydrolases superfamily protein [Euphorbia peplus]|nr:alpha/beta-Hydrolases superfamily protein [Euphorbia peplus]
MPENHSDFRNLIISNSNGTYTRLIQFPTTPASRNSSSHVLTKDIQINPFNQTWLRIYLPRHLLDSPSITTTTANNCRRRPLIVYFHGGGFVFDTPASTHNHDFCFNMSQNINAIVVSVQYRLAPEHRLPAAYDDVVEVLRIIKLGEDDWLSQFAELSSCFLMGTSAGRAAPPPSTPFAPPSTPFAPPSDTSRFTLLKSKFLLQYELQEDSRTPSSNESGGNIVYQATLRAFKLELEPLKIKGLILHHPFFGGSERTVSELNRVFDPILPLAGNDYMWELSLPAGSNRDHEYCNPRTNFELNKFGLFSNMDLRVLVLGCSDDPLIDRYVELAKMLEEKGVKTVTHLVEGLHGLEVNHPKKAESLFPILIDFMSSRTT